MNISPLPMEISAHALERWAQRVRQDEEMRPKSARLDMERCAAVGTLQEHPPAWMYVHHHLYLHKAEYLMLGDDVAIVVRRSQEPNKPWVVATVMTRHDSGGVHAAELRAQRQARRAAQHPPPSPGSVFPPRSYDDGWKGADEPLDPDEPEKLN